MLSQLAALQLDYVDLYMLHSPFSNFELQMQTWQVPPTHAHS